MKAAGRFRGVPDILPAVFACGNPPLILVKYSTGALGAKNNDSLSEKYVIVKFYTLKNQNVAVSNNKTIAAYAWVHLPF